LRFTHKNTKLVIMYQLNEKDFPKYASNLQNIIENVDII